jgi:hypothetical protein
MDLISSLKPRLRAAGIHFAASALFAAAASLLIFKLWYPSPFASIAGAFTLFTLLVSVDVMLGPALTAVVASPGKALHVLARDLAVIVAVQLAAFGYGVYTLALARPVALVFEVDLMRLVSAADIEPGALQAAPPALRQLSWAGPRLLAAAKPSEGDEQFRSIELGLAGIHLAMQPVYWRDYASQSTTAWRAARPVSKLVSHYPASAEQVAQVADSAGLPAEALRYLPLTSRHADWVTLIAPPDARVVGYLPLDGCF